MTVLLTPSPDPDDPKEQRTLTAAVAVLSPGETLRILPGTWSGNVTFPPQTSLVGSGRDNTQLPGKLLFPGGGSIRNLELTETSEIIHGSGSGSFKNLYWEGSGIFNGGIIAGNNIESRRGRGTITVKVNAGVSIQIDKASLGPIAIAGTSFILNSTVFALGQGGGVANITDVYVGTTVTISGGTMNMNNVNVQQSITILSSGSGIIPPGGNVVINGV